MSAILYSLRSALVVYRASCEGAAAAEFALFLTVLTIPVLNVVDLGYYTYQKMQLENAALAGSEIARSFCNAKVPATDSVKCPGFNTAETNAITSTSLGGLVTPVAGFPIEAYYCALTTGGLQLVGTAGTMGSPPTPPTPNTCDAVANHSAANGTRPSDYIRVSVSYTFTPVFGNVSVVALLPTPIVKTTWARLD